MDAFEAGCSEICSLHLVEAFFHINQPGTTVQESMELMVRKYFQLKSILFVPSVCQGLDKSISKQIRGCKTSPLIHHYQSHVLLVCYQTREHWRPVGKQEESSLCELERQVRHKGLTIHFRNDRILQITLYINQQSTCSEHA